MFTYRFTKLCVAAFCVVLLTAVSTQASLIIEVRVTKLNGASVPDGHNVLVKAGDTLTLQVYAQPGTNPDNNWYNDYLWSTQGAVYATQNAGTQVIGHITAAITALSPFTSGAYAGLLQDYDTDTKMDGIGPGNLFTDRANANSLDNGWWYVRSGSPTYPDPEGDPPVSPNFPIARFTYVVDSATGSGAPTTIKALLRTQVNDLNKTNNSGWQEEGVPITPSGAGGPFDLTKATVNLTGVPEPSTLVLLVLGAAAFFAIRRRMR